MLVLSFSLPGLLRLFRAPSFSNLNLAMHQCALLFFLFGYRTHEKSIIWYIFALQLSSFEFSPSLLNFLNLTTLLIIRPMVVEYGK